ncbi:hypothetical protein [Streptomyces odontomachi]|uniref:hypothetical protein n=1 Tax=Streptomyces odontomachi TaxID=2944940 RepID=UPI00210D60D4|nr:hypothetical protein [Streptomyces sp. ODS25]
MRRAKTPAGKEALRAAAIAVTPGPCPNGVFADPAAIGIGSVLYDRDRDMPGRVRNVDGQVVELERPTGCAWRVHYRRLRPATEREQRQLTALGRLHRQQQKRLPPGRRRPLLPP